MVFHLLRISPDHGPNSKMFGKNKSDPSSFFYAMKFIRKIKIIMKPKKSLGQNFLNDEKILNKIVDNGNISKKDDYFRNWTWNRKFNKKNN